MTAAFRSDPAWLDAQQRYIHGAGRGGPSADLTARGVAAMDMYRIEVAYGTRGRL